jgi:histone H3
MKFSLKLGHQCIRSKDKNMTTPTKSIVSKKRHTSFNLYVSRMCKVLGCSISNKATVQVAKMVEVLTRALAQDARSATSYAKRKNITSRDVLFAATNLWGDIAFLREYIKRKVAMWNEKHETGLVLPVARINKLLKDTSTFGAGKVTGITLTAIVEFIITEWLKGAAEVAREYKIVRITPRHLLITAKSLQDMAIPFEKLHVALLEGGVLPNIHAELLPHSHKKHTVVKTDAAIKRPHRFRPGTVALREIRRYQKSTILLHQKQPIREVIKVLAEPLKDEKVTKVRFSAGVTTIMQALAEQAIITLLEKAQSLAIFSKRISVQRKDLHMVARLTDSLASFDTELKVPCIDKIKRPALIRMARRAGVRMVSAPCYNELRQVMSFELYSMLTKSWECTRLRGGKIINIEDLKQGCNRLGKTLPI